MINQKAAQDLIDSLNHMFHIELSIINEKGIIIASSRINLVGEFHPIAQEMIQRHIKENVEKSPSGTTINHYLLLHQESIPYGVIDIFGSDAGNKKLAYVLRYHIEDLLTSSSYNQARRINRTNEIFDSLFCENPVNYGKVVNLFHKYRYDLHTLRLPVLVHLPNAQDADLVYKRLHNMTTESTQNLLFRFDTYDILLFLKISYEDPLKGCLSELKRAIESGEDSNLIYKLAYTAPTDDIRLYGLSFCQLIWLKNVHALKQKKYLSIVDDLDLLLVSSNSWDNYNNIFIYYKKKLEYHGILEDYISLAEVLIKHNMNYNKAAKALFVHKNTIVFRMNKIKSLLEIDPYTVVDHLALFSYLYYYIQLERNTLLSFQKVKEKIFPSLMQ